MSHGERERITQLQPKRTCDCVLKLGFSVQVNAKLLLDSGISRMRLGAEHRKRPITSPMLSPEFNSIGAHGRECDGYMSAIG
eukprot:2353652-Amphidinium_carterae.1